MTLEESFWAKVDRSELGPAGCWPWTGAIDRKGYGRFHNPGASQIAHRIAFWLTNGHWPSGDALRHYICGFAACCNPAHTKPGTHQENVADTVAMGRIRRGERSVRAKLTDAVVVDIRGRWAAGETPTALAKEYGVSRRAVSFACRGVTWRHVPFDNSANPSFHPARVRL